MTSTCGLIEAIVENPEDDLARLAYADWLEEQGDPHHHAEFIRLQMRREGLWVNGYYSSLDYRIGGLHLNHAYDWLEEFYPLAVCFAKLENWERGFPWKIECDSVTWEDFGKKLVKRFPLTYVTLTDKKPRQCYVTLTDKTPSQCSDGWRFWWSSSTPLAKQINKDPSPKDFNPKEILPKEWFELAWPGHGRDCNWPEGSEKSCLDRVSKSCLEWARLP